jgi:YbbR domain-containing protein
MRIPALRPRPSPEPVEPGGPVRPGGRWRHLPRPPRLPNRGDVLSRIRRNSVLKLLSTLLAVFLWYSIRVSGREAESSLSVPIRVDYLAPDLIVTNLPGEPAEVVVQGPTRILDGLTEGRYRFALDLSAASAGKNRIDLSGELIKPKLPDVVSVRKIDPPRLDVRIERVTRKRLPVHAELEGRPEVGYIIAQVHVTPREVEAVGPVTRLRDLDGIKTEPVRLRRATGKIERNVLLSWAGDYVTLSPDHVTVSVVLQQQMVSRVFEDVPIVVRNAPSGERVEVTPKGIELTIAGPQPTLMNYALPEGSVYIDAAGLGHGSHRVTPAVELPEGLEVTRREPEFHTLQLGPPPAPEPAAPRKPRR